jgi:hypothetical protein
MNCQDIAAALVDEHLPRPPGFQAHLESCPECGMLARLHASATSLRFLGPPAPATIPREAILGEVRRRQHRRRLVASVTATAAVVALVLLVSSRVRTPVPVESNPVGGPTELYLPVEQAGASGQPGHVAEAEVVPLGVLFDEVYGYTRTDPGFEDEMYRPFGALAAWVRPTDSTALDSEPFRTALVAFHSPRFR